METKHYYPQLDSIRGFFFLVVFFFHACHPVFGTTIWEQFFQFLWNCMIYCIDVFFVLSSFLLTWLGLNELDKEGHFSFKNYFIRRLLRIWPLYYTIMFFAFVILPLVIVYLRASVSLPPPGWYLFFISNFYEKDHVYFLRFLWTISVEEQFYLILGICLVFFHRKLFLIAVIGVIISLVLNLYGTYKGWDIYFNTATYLYDLCIGVLIALFAKKGNIIFRKIASLSSRSIRIIYGLLPTYLIIAFLIQMYTTLFSSAMIWVCVKLIFILFTAFSILEQAFNKNTPFNFGKSKFLTFTGKRSYGLYCFHGIILTFGILGLNKLDFFLPELPRALLLLAITYLIASLSYRYFESPFLRWKKRFK